MSSFVPQSRRKRLFRMRDGLSKTKRSRTNRDSRFGLEPLEDRLVLSVYTVTNINYSGTGSLGAAIAAAISSDDSQAQIEFSSFLANSTISLTASDADASTTYGPTGYVISGSGVNITIDGSGAPGLTIDGTGAIRLFAVTSTASLTLTNLTVSGGLAQGFVGGLGTLGGGGGGGAGLGGAVYDDGGSFTAEGVTFTNNVAQGGGGGDALNNFVNLGNVGAGGGGLSGAGQSGNAGGTGGLNGGGRGGTSDVRAGGAGGLGGGGGGGGGRGNPGGAGGAGGLGGGGGGGGSRSGNSGPGGFGGGNGGKGAASYAQGGAGGGGAGLGGAIFSNGGSLSLVNDTFTGNTAEGGFRGNSLPRGNDGSGYGGAVFAVNGILSATFDTFSSNTAEDGLGIPLDGTDVYVLSDLTDSGVHGRGTFVGTFVDDILGQSSATTSDFVANTTKGGAAPSLTAQHNLISNNSPSTGAGLPPGPTGLGGDPMLGPLESNGGPTQALALMPTSPAIGAGITADFPGTQTPITTDQRGYPRPTTPDIGATQAFPTVTGLNPDAGPLSGGTLVTITGGNFTGATAVDFGSRPAASFSVVSATAITAVSPAGAAGPVDVTVTSAEGTSNTGSADIFTYAAAPTVTGVNPTVGPLAGGVTITITGTDFTRATAVHFGGAAATNVTVVNDSEITAVSPPSLTGAVGAVNVTVTTPGGTSATSPADQYTYAATPSSYVVTSTDYNPNEVGTLAYAINTAINFLDPHALITFDLPNNSTIALDSEDVSPASIFGPTAYVISGSGVGITIDGSGAPGLTIDGSGEIRVFAVTSTVSLTLEDLTVSGGLAQGFDGGSSYLGGGGGGGAGLGGAVYDGGGSFSAEGVTFTNDIARGGTGGNAIIGSTTSGASGVGGGGGGLSGSGLSGSTGGTGGINGGGNGGSSGNEDDGDGEPGDIGGFGGGGGGGGSGTFFGSRGGSGGFGGGGGGGGAGRSGSNGHGGDGGLGGFSGGAGGTGGKRGNIAGAGGGGGGGAGLGGAIFSNGGSITLVNDTFTANTAAGGAGGSTLPTGGSVSGEAGGGAGGAVFAVNGNMNATFVTFSGNTAEDGAGNSLDGTDIYVLTDLGDTGIHGDGTFDGTFVDDILGQTSANTSDFVANATNDGTAPTLSAQYDLISNNNPTMLEGSTGLPSGPTLFSGDPMVGALSSNGGPTPTLALLLTSPAIAAGITADFPDTQTPITTDQRGYIRATPPNIGAYGGTQSIPPTVTGLNPAIGPLTGGTLVTITGTGFIGETGVDFGTTPATNVTVVSDTTITADSPPGTGVVDVTVVTLVGSSPTSPADQFTYTSVAPTITVSPASLDLGTTPAGIAGTAECYTVSGANLTADLTVTAPTGVQVSDNGCSTWYSSLTLTESDGTVASTMINVRISPTAAVGSVTGSISNASAGATTQDVAVSGTVTIDTVHGILVSSIPQSSSGEDVTFTATFFTAAEGGAAPMTGTVAFYDGTTNLGTVPLTDPPVFATASLSLSSLALGSHSITAVYSGDANHSSSTTAPPVAFQVIPAVTTLTLTASSTSQGTTLSANVAATSPGTPTVAGSVDFYVDNTLVGTEPVSNSVAILNLAPLSPGVHTFQASFSGGGSTASSTSPQISLDGPQVTSVLRYGLNGQQTYILLYFNGPLDPTSAENVANYTIAGPLNKHGQSSHRINVGSAIYDPTTNSVTLRTAAPLSINMRYTLTVNGTTPFGVTNPSRMLLDGVGNGKPGSNYVTTITRRNLAGPASKLPTIGLLSTARSPKAVAKTSTRHTHTTFHIAAVDHLLESGLLRIPKHRARS